MRVVKVNVLFNKGSAINDFYFVKYFDQDLLLCFLLIMYGMKV